MPGFNLRAPVILLALFLHGSAGAAAAADGYENPPRVTAGELLDAGLLQSPDHRVDNPVSVRDLFYGFSIETDYGTLHAGSLAMLRLRVHELKTVANTLQRFRETDTRLHDEIRGQLQVTGGSVARILTSPLSTASELASELGRNVQTASELARGIALDRERTLGGARETVPERPVPAQQAGDFVYQAHKRTIANQLQLDPYSTNPLVQGLLDRLARARGAGQDVSGLGGPLITAAGHSAFGRPLLENQIRVQVKNLGPVELGIENDRLLQRMGVPRAVRERFLSHPWYSPRHQTVIAVYLTTLDGVANRSAIVEAALEAASEEDAEFYEELVRILSWLHVRGDRLVRIETVSGIPLALTAARRLVAVMPVDLVYWNREFAAIAGAVAAHADRLNAAGVDLLTTGTVSAQARTRLAGLRFGVRERFHP